MSPTMQRCHAVADAPPATRCRYSAQRGWRKAAGSSSACKRRGSIRGGRHGLAVRRGKSHAPRVHGCACVCVGANFRRIVASTPLLATTKLCGRQCITIANTVMQLLRGLFSSFMQHAARTRCYCRTRIKVMTKARAIEVAVDIHTRPITCTQGLATSSTYFCDEQSHR